MNDININELLEKYWAAETTLEEEQLIRQYHKSGMLPSQPEHQAFDYFEVLKSQEFKGKIPAKPVKARMFNLRVLLSIAASVIILTAAFFSLNSTAKSNQKVITDPDEALEMTLAALSVMNGSIEASENAVLKNMKQFEKTRIFKL